MGANPTQAYGVCLFLIGFTLISVGLAGGGILIGVLGLAVVAGSAMVFLKAKPWEHQDQ